MSTPPTPDIDIEQLRAELHSYGKVMTGDVCARCGEPAVSCGWPKANVYTRDAAERIERWAKEGLLPDIDPAQYADTLFCEDCAEAEIGHLAGYARQHSQARAMLRRIPGQPQGMTFDVYAGRDADAARIAETCRDWLALESRPNLVLWGDTGVGKTTAAALTAHAVIEGGGSVEWIHVASHLDRIKRSWDEKCPEPKVNLNAALVVLDDLGLERTTPWTRDVISKWIMARADTGLPMLVTANYSPDKLAAHLTGNGGKGEAPPDPVVGKRLISRIVGNGAVVLQAKGPDRRLEMNGNIQREM